MKAIVACVAEHAWVENGCLSICRAFDSINMSRFPFTVSRMSVALTLLIGRQEQGEHKLNISLADPDGKKLISSDFNFDFRPPEIPIPESSFSFALNGQNIIIPKAGDYVVYILVDGRLEASVPIYIREKQKQSNSDIPDRV